MLQKNWSELIKPTKMEVNVEESNGRIAKLTAEPLERGFGLTLGNSIRRILLSSLQGAAITSIKIKGVVHEFSTIPGVKEDLTDILLNLKTIGVKVHSPGLKKMYLKSSGSGELRAGNFETDSETEIMNPDHEICTLDESAKLSIEFNVDNSCNSRILSNNKQNKFHELLLLHRVNQLTVDPFLTKSLQYLFEHNNL